MKNQFDFARFCQVLVLFLNFHSLQSQWPSSLPQQHQSEDKKLRAKDLILFGITETEKLVGTLTALEDLLKGELRLDLDITPQTVHRIGSKKADHCE